MYRYELKLDFDFKPRSAKRFAKEIANKLNFLASYFSISVIDVSVYETNKGLHLYISIYSSVELDDRDIVVLQLALGSDYKRELFNWLRVRSNDKFKHWNVLFKVKYKNGKIISKEEKTELAEEIEYYVRKYLQLYNHVIVQYG